jgi:hypothetical protein
VGEGVVTRIVRRTAIPPRESGIVFTLMLGPTEGEFVDEQLELGWRVYGEELMADLAARPGLPGTRPWAYWEFELKEERPARSGQEAIRLAELGLLRDDELAAIAERANEARVRIGTTAEHYGADRRAIELHEAVKKAFGR